MKNFYLINDIRLQAKGRVPRFVWSYLSGGTGRESQQTRDFSALDAILFRTRISKDIENIDLSCNIFGIKYSLPFGVAPVGLSGFIWPNSEEYIATAATSNNIPYALSTVATSTPEEIGVFLKNGWFQLYPPKDLDVLKSLLNRAKRAGFTRLIVTADIPMPSIRESARKSGFPIPPKYSFRLILQALRKPIWGIKTIVTGPPRLKTVESYTSVTSLKFVSGFVGNRLGGSLNENYLKLIRDLWDGPLILKGIMHPDDAQLAVKLKYDGIIVSNHGARQFDANISPISALKDIKKVVGSEIKIFYDGAIRDGLDIMRALSVGADFVLMGRAFLYGAIVGDTKGVNKVIEIYKNQLENSMAQIGVNKISEIFQKHLDNI